MLMDRADFVFIEAAARPQPVVSFDDISARLRVKRAAFESGLPGNIAYLGGFPGT